MFNKKKESKKELEQIRTESTIIAAGTVIEGNIETGGNIRIEGKVIGNIKCKSKIAMGPAAVVEGNVMAVNAEIEGEIKGMIEVSELLVLKTTGLVNGDIVANKLMVESGGAFNGQCKMGTLVKEGVIKEAIIKEIKIGHEEKHRPKEKFA